MFCYALLLGQMKTFDSKKCLKRRAYSFGSMADSCWASLPRMTVFDVRSIFLLQFHACR